MFSPGLFEMNEKLRGPSAILLELNVRRCMRR